jgi:RecA-family ATPase
MLKKVGKDNDSGPVAPDPLEPPQAPAVEQAQQEAERRKASSDRLRMFAKTPPPKQDYVWRGFLRRTVGGVIASGSTGKSFWAMEAAMCVASAKANALLLKLDIPTHGRVVIFNAEDPNEIFWQRFHATCALLDPADIDAMVDNMDFVPLFGRADTDMNDIMFVHELLEYAKGSRLVIFDTLNRFAGEAEENSNAEMALLLKRFEYIAANAGPGVLVLHHSSKNASANGQQHKQESARGASSITSNLRWQAFMQGMSTEEALDLGVAEEQRHNYVQFGGNKENYGQKTPATWLKRHEHGVLLPFDFQAEAEAKAAIRQAKKKEKDATYAETLKTTDAEERRALEARQAADDKVRARYGIKPDGPPDPTFQKAEPYSEVHTLPTQRRKPQVPLAKTNKTKTRSKKYGKE